MLFLDALPRTVALIGADGSSSDTLNEAAADAVASFFSEGCEVAGAPVAVMIDQTRLPLEEAYVCTTDWREVVDAIKRLAVRGAPALGIAGAMALTLRAFELCGEMSGVDPCDDADFRARLSDAAHAIAQARPTAVNLSAEVARAYEVAERALVDGLRTQQAADALSAYTCELIREDEERCRAIGCNGAALLRPSSCVLTHCNAGSLACSFYGTALGVVYAAAYEGKISRVYADETRPVCQGARLTVWELARARVPVTLICDDMAASVMASGAVDAVIVGADRIALNGDTANKIGTLGLAVLARYFRIPFYVAAPLSTFDPRTSDGRAIPIEERAAAEVLACPLEGVDVYNPAFDVTPADLIDAVITEAGVFAPGELAQVVAR
ncbi:S-methyl-5-thioribose-1-phosphate isomerase [Adlercreutzia murintestinalis]|uniref:S-methyl-5-thioribose-1-phosphate isomerase n=1 Tax=Adlercreutzia murintestinalis TaxID=2941325 RepID=UPI00204232AA|nr:S-methyl-5-thioribose-1-phosphate isomerase [Adlercreutzia murintestinalis]